MTDKPKVEFITPVNVVGFILVMMAGWVDIVGLRLFFNERSAFQTGRASQLGRWFAEGDMENFKFVIIIVLSFMVGAAISTAITKSSGLSGGLGFTGILLILTAYGIGSGNAQVAAITIPMAMGGQNAATSLTAINRTTHLTGPATDIGMNAANGNWNMVVFWALRWIGFPLGVFVALSLMAGDMSSEMALAIPGVVILLTGLIQKATVNIPLK